MRVATQASEGLRSRLVNSFGMVGLAVALAAGSLAVGPQVAAASGKKVVIVVGPTGSTNSYMKGVADDAATAARQYTSNVIKVYTPYATWKRVTEVAAGANVLIYVGHGNGWPSPYPPFQTYTKDGLGLNAKAGAGSGDNNLKYWGERYLPNLHLAPNAVVILMRLCYASGNSEMGKAYPTKDVAKARVDNYGAGFLRSGARAVFAEGLGKSAYIFKALFTSTKTMHAIFWSDPSATFSYRMAFASTRSPSWARAEMDPRWPGSYYRSFIGDASMTAGNWRSG